MFGYLFHNFYKETLEMILESTNNWYNPKRYGIVAQLKKWEPFLKITVLVAHYVSMYFEGFEKALQLSAFYAVIGTISNSQHLVNHLNQKDFNILLKSLKVFPKVRTQQEEVFFQIEWKKPKKLITMYWNVNIGYILVYIIPPASVDLIVGLMDARLPSFRVPLPLQGLIDLSRPRSLLNFLITLVAICWVVTSIVAFLGQQISLVMVIVYARTEMKIICQKFERIKRNGPQTHGSLKNVVLHHIQVIKMLDQISNVYGLPISIQNSIVAGCFCLSLYQTTIVIYTILIYLVSNFPLYTHLFRIRTRLCNLPILYSLHALLTEDLIPSITLKDMEDLLTAVQGLFALVVLLCLIFYLCMEGESLETQNNEILQSLYDLPWHEETPDFRKELNMMIRQAKKPYVITYHRRSHLNVATFMQIVGNVIFKMMPQSLILMKY